MGVRAIDWLLGLRKEGLLALPPTPPNSRVSECLEKSHPQLVCSSIKSASLISLFDGLSVDRTNLKQALVVEGKEFSVLGVLIGELATVNGQGVESPTSERTGCVNAASPLDQQRAGSISGLVL